MSQIIRFIMLILVTFVLVSIVTDFQSVVDGFSDSMDAISSLIRPGK
jgi:hypothetical protein